MDEERPVQFAAAAGDVHAAFDLQGLAPRDFVMQKLIGMRIRRGTPNAATDFDFDAHRGVRRAVALDVRHDQVGAVFRGGAPNVVIRQVGAMLEQHVARKRVHLVEIVVGAAGQRLFFRRLVYAHVHAGVLGRAHFAAENRDNLALNGRSELGVGSQVLVGVPTLLERSENPFGQIHFCAHLHFAFVRKSAFGVRKIEVHFALGVPPGLDQIAVQRAVKPYRVALGGQENLHEALRGGVPQSREINNVPAIGE